MTYVVFTFYLYFIYPMLTYFILTMSNRDNETPNVNWTSVIKKEARGQNGEDLGEVQNVGDTYVLVPKKA